MRAALLACVVPALLVACTDTARWTSEPGESWCGEVTSASFVRAGMPEHTKLRLQLDAESLQNAPGALWTSAFSSGERFSGSELRVVPQLLHDPLSTLSFGEGRVKNAVYVADLPDASGGKPTQVFVVLSLLQSGGVEVRLLRGASPGSATPSDTGEPTQLFGVFELARAKGDCGLP